MSVYADSSFLFSYYVADRHTQEVDRRMLGRPKLFVTAFHLAEVANANYQWVFRGKMPLAQAQQAINHLEFDCNSGLWSFVEFPTASFLACVELARKHVASLGVRTLDSLHVAAALELGASHFWTFDERQARLAEAEGLSTN